MREPRLTRRQALAAGAGLGGALLLPACAGVRGPRPPPPWARRRLSRDADCLHCQGPFDVVVVGSGYGGGVSALRLAAALGPDRKLALLERGLELHPGEYPASTAEVSRQIQWSVHGVASGPPTALIDLRIHRDINVAMGCGLGGTSLINCNAAIHPSPEVLGDPWWPAGFRNDLPAFEAGIARAQAMLEPRTIPIDVQKLDAHRACGRELERAGYQADFARAPITVTFEDRCNAVGIPQLACEGCGECVPACNYRAKNTVLMNYLPAAHAAGAQIFTRVAVRWLEPLGAGWRIHYRLTDQPDGPERSVEAKRVVLAAGTLGTNEILLRSRERGLDLSDRLGERFSGNGDVIAFAYNGDRVVNGVGYGDRDPAEMRRCIGPVGPTITSLIDLRRDTRFGGDVIVEDGAIPGAIADLFRGLAFLPGTDTDGGAGDAVRESLRSLGSLLGGPYHGALHNTLMFLAMCPDGAGGRIHLEGDALAIEWPGLKDLAIFGQVGEMLTRASAGLGATYVRNPIQHKLWNQHITVHPLGGCALADDAAKGVCNHEGQVFDTTAGGSLHPGLYVNDAAVIPMPLGANPLLTISALAERACARWIASAGWRS